MNITPTFLIKDYQSFLKEQIDMNQQCLLTMKPKTILRYLLKNNILPEGLMFLLKKPDPKLMKQYQNMIYQIQIKSKKLKFDMNIP